MGDSPGDLASVLLAHTQDKVAVVDEAGTFRYVNEAVERMLGHDPDALVGESAFTYIHPDDRTAAQDCFERVIASDEPVTETVRYRFRTADGGWAWLESRCSNVTDEALGGYVVSSRDVTEQVTAERGQATAESRLREITRTVSDVMWMFSADWSELLFLNPAYETVYGQSIETLRADPTAFLDTVHPDDVPKVEEAMARLSAGERVDIEYRVNPDRGYDTYVWVRGEPVTEGGEVVRIVGFSRDITDRRRRERQLAVMDNLLRHNLRNDLSVVLGHAEFIAREGDADSADRAELIRRKGQSLLETAEKQRTIIELLTEGPRLETFAVADVVRQAVAVVRQRHPEVVIETDVPDDLSVRGLADIEQALVELLENAVRHDPDGVPEAEVTARGADDRVLVTVTDSCPPIPESEFRVLTGEREMDSIYHSSGLGLWLVYWAVDLSDGRIAFSHADDAGNTVELNLPRADGEQTGD